MPDKLFGPGTVRTTPQGWKGEVGKPALIGLDIGAEICDNEHTVDRAYGDVLVGAGVGVGPSPFSVDGPYANTNRLVPATLAAYFNANQQDTSPIPLASTIPLLSDQLHPRSSLIGNQFGQAPLLSL